MADRLQVDMIVKAIAKGFDGLVKNLKEVVGVEKEVAKATDGVSTAMKTTTSFGKEFKKQYDAIVASFSAGNLSMEEASAKLGELRAAYGSVGESMAKARKEQAKASGGFVKQLKQMAKGLVGVATAYAAGRWLVNFAKDSLAAAEAAGLLPPIFKKSEKASDRLKKAVGEGLGNTLEETVTVMTRMKNSTAANLEITNRLTEAEKKGIITTKESAMLRGELTLGMRSHVDVVGILTEAESKYLATLVPQGKALRERNRELARGLQDMEELVRRRGGRAGRLSPQDKEDIETAKNEIADFMDQVAISEAVGRQGALDITGAVGGIGQVGALLDQIEQFDVGVLETQQHYATLVASFREGLVTSEFVTQEAEKIGVIYAQQALEAGIVNTESQAAGLLVDELGISWGEALELIRDIPPILEDFQTPLEEATEELSEFTDLLKKIDGTTYDVFIKLLMGFGGRGFISGGPQAAPGVTTAGGLTFLGGQQQGIAPPGFIIPIPIPGGQHGLQGIVPPGFPNDSFMVGASSGESLEIRTPGQQQGMSTAALESEMIGMRSDIKNALLDIGQMIAERG